jgi:acyl carrier protein
MDDLNKLEEAVFLLIGQMLARPLDRAAVTPDTNLRRDLGLDSLALAMLLVRFGEEQLGVDPDDIIEKVAVDRIHTVGDVVAMGAELAGHARVAPEQAAP